eukprot:c24717_g1_i1 orf=146-1396(-)
MADLSVSKLRIAICHPDLGIGGAERLIVDAASELASRGYHVHVFTAHHDKNRCFEETKNGRFTVTVYGDFLPRNIFYLAHAICAYIRCIYVALCMRFFWPSFDVVLTDQVSAVIPFLKCRSSKVIFYCHFPDLLLAQHTTRLRKFYRWFIDWLEEKTTGMADCVLVNSQFTAATFNTAFKSLHAKGIRPTILYPAVDVEQFAIDRSAPTPHKQHLILSINRFERKKNIDLAIAAFSLLCHHLSETEAVGGSSVSDFSLKLVVAGGYDERLRENREYLQELKHLAEEKGVTEHVVFLPSCSTAERDALLAACVCVVYTPLDEHFGIVPLEAMAAGKPVIACNSGGPKESIVHNLTGFLCEPTPQNFSSAMLLLLKHSQRAEVMGRAARQHVQVNFSRKVFGDRLNMILLNSLESQKQ